MGFQVRSQTPYVHQGAHVMWATPPCAPWLGYPEPACERSCLARTRLKTGPSLIPHGIAYCLRVRRQSSLTGSAKSPHTGAAPRQTPRRPLDTAGSDANARSRNDGNATRPPARHKTPRSRPMAARLPLWSHPLARPRAPPPSAPAQSARVGSRVRRGASGRGWLGGGGRLRGAERSGGRWRAG